MYVEGTSLDKKVCERYRFVAMHVSDPEFENQAFVGRGVGASSEAVEGESDCDDLETGRR